MNESPPNTMEKIRDNCKAELTLQRYNQLFHGGVEPGELICATGLPFIPPIAPRHGKSNLSMNLVRQLAQTHPGIMGGMIGADVPEDVLFQAQLRTHEEFLDRVDSMFSDPITTYIESPDEPGQLRLGVMAPIHPEEPSDVAPVWPWMATAGNQLVWLVAIRPNGTSFYLNAQTDYTMSGDTAVLSENAENLVKRERARLRYYARKRK